MKENYDSIWKAFIRPHRNYYNEIDLGIKTKINFYFILGPKHFKSGKYNC